VKKQLRSRFRSLTIVQVLLIVVTISLFAWSILSTNFHAVPFVLILVLLLQIGFLLRHVEAHVDALEDFFAAVNYEDFTRRFIEDDVDAELKEAFNSVLARFQDARADRDVQAGYLETVIRHVPVPFIAARADGSLVLVNNPARRLTGLSAFTHLDQLSDLDPELPNMMRKIDAGSRQLLQTRLRGIPAELRVSVSEIRISGDVDRLYSIENLSGELTAREASAWRNLIRVLTHEIMNTLTPVTSLAKTAAGLLQESDATEDVRSAVQTIARRSEGLVDFVLRYRELMKVPQPVIASVNVKSALNELVTLMSTELQRVDVHIEVVPSSLLVSADSALLDQILVNLVRNALDAMTETSTPRLELQGKMDFGRTMIRVTDNGPGMDEETLSHIFVPFYTTKREGSGIGLSLSRQIMSAHNGEIVVESTHAGTTVTLVFD